MHHVFINLVSSPVWEAPFLDLLYLLHCGGLTRAARRQVEQDALLQASDIRVDTVVLLDALNLRDTPMKQDLERTFLLKLCIATYHVLCRKQEVDIVLTPKGWIDRSLCGRPVGCCSQAQQHKAQMICSSTTRWSGNQGDAGNASKEVENFGNEATGQNAGGR